MPSPQAGSVMAGRSLLLWLLVAASGCQKLTPLEGLKCPCAEGLVCCENRCLSRKTCPNPDLDVDAGGLAGSDGSSTAGEKHDAPTVTGGQDAAGGEVADLGAQDVAPSSGYAEISVGERHACVIRNDGTVSCWGDNGLNEEVAPTGAFRQISVGLTSRCALSREGAVRCWGLCTLNFNDPCRNPPAGPFVFLSGGSDDRCAIAADGTVTCWGPSGLRAPAGSFQKVAVGQGFACGLRKQDILCWGPNAVGMQIPAHSYADVTAASNWACGLTAEGGVTCWGTPPLVPSMPGLSGQAAIALGTNAGCALDAAGALSCWGKSSAIKETPSSTLRFTKFSMSGATACGITTAGQLACLGLDPWDATRPPATPLIDMCAGQSRCWVTAQHELQCSVWVNGPGLDNIRMPGFDRLFCDGRGTMCALTSAGDMHCWGQERPIAKAIGPFTDVAIPTFDTVCALRTDKTIKCFGPDSTGRPPSGTFRSIAGSGGNICGLTTEGTVVCWGGYDPALIPAGKFVAMAANQNSICAIDASGGVTCNGVLHSVRRHPESSRRSPSRTTMPAGSETTAP